MKEDNSFKTEASLIYDVIYGPIARKENYKITDKSKSYRIERILNTLTFDEKTALRCCCRYKGKLGYQEALDMAAKISGMDKHKLDKSYRLSRRHVYSPNNIRLAVPKFYKLGKIDQTKLDKFDFGGQQYIVTALSKSGIDTREKLYKHLSLGWFYLYTIPGCGTNARIRILEAIDKWSGKSF